MGTLTDIFTDTVKPKSVRKQSNTSSMGQAAIEGMIAQLIGELEALNTSAHDTFVLNPPTPTYDINGGMQTDLSPHGKSMRRNHDPSWVQSSLRKLYAMHQNALRCEFTYAA